MTDLDEDTDYAYSVAVSNGWETSALTAPETVHTARNTIEFHSPGILAPTNVTSQGFEARWNPLTDADGYLVTVYLKQDDTPYEDVCDFTDGTKTLPEGWDSSSRSSYSNASYSGEAMPALRCSSADDWITTPSFSDHISAISFWHRGNSIGADDRILLQACIAGDWRDIATCPIVSAAGGSVNRIEEMPAETTAVKIVFDRKGTRGSLALDDIKVLHGMQFTLANISGYTDIPAGAVTSLSIDGLQPDTEYAYSVRGTDGSLISRESEKMFVRTGLPGAIDNVNGDSRTLLTVSGHLVTAADAGQLITVTDIAGHEVAAGTGSVLLPRTPGIYIVSAPGAASVIKIAVR